MNRDHSREVFDRASRIIPGLVTGRARTFGVGGGVVENVFLSNKPRPPID